ncbi:PPC domain-containing protein [Pontiella sulfatireligans]|uniref:Putative subtilase-type serine protease n=1 Tax=Pontiella sulfatireligans TaxID=2750658 RepID=A0A6C2ULY8_9BACT|nr:PPC domain-containing protein [Pontiella sulfatireligans]VGO20923.1 putative subtilase-type serine protease [Pontiella sulfatireligans]
MKTRLKLAVAAVVVAGAGLVQAKEPHIGYAFPAGGPRGTSFVVFIGGQYLNGATNVFVSGEGVSVQIEKYTVKYEPKKLSQIFRNIQNATATLEDGAEGKEKEKLEKRIAMARKQLTLADLPEGTDPFDRKMVQRYARADPKEQFNPQISDRLRVRVNIGKNAPPSERELRVYTPAGLSNPIYFQVGTLPETLEEEPNDDHMMPGLQTVPVPSVINGQVRPGDIDHFQFKANKGDSIVVDVAARRIIPYLADAVPGWFQAVAALYDDNGNEVAYQDDYKFHPDPVLFFDVPKTGTYTLSIRDSIYRGREDFIYRIAIGELPFITSIFPLGAEQGKEVDIALIGKNLPKTRLTGKLPKNGFEVRHVSVKREGYRSNEMPFAIGEMREAFETEPNNTPAEAQPIEQPLLINGCIEQEGDRDVFSFQGRKGDSLSIEVIARRLNSSLDSVITLTGPGLEKPMRNDDYMNRDKTYLHLGAGLVTHHADSYLLHTLPATGTYFVEIGDAQSKGGNEYGYRLRISPSNPDFKLRMEPSGLQIASGGTAAFSIRALRMEGFDGKIQLDAANLPSGFSMSEAVIPAGSDLTRFTITAPKEIHGKLISPEISGTGIVAGRPVTRPAVPVDDQMQAFLYRHLVPAKELVLAPVSKQSPLNFEARIPKSGVVYLPLGQEVRVILDGKSRSGAKGFQVKIDHPPEGIAFKKGWIARKKLKGKNAEGKQRYHKSDVAGAILITAGEPLKPGDELSLVVMAVERKGKEEFLYPAPAIPVKIVKPK